MPIVDIDSTRPVIEKILKRQIQPGFSFDVPATDHTPLLARENFNIEIRWSTLLLHASLKVFLDKVDITSKFWVDHDERKATASLAMPRLGAHMLEATGQFLSDLLPLQLVQLSASRAFDVIAGTEKTEKPPV